MLFSPRNEGLPTTWMKLEGIVLSETKETEKDEYGTISHLCGT